MLRGFLRGGFIFINRERMRNSRNCEIDDSPNN